MPAATVSLAYGIGAILTSSVENTGVSALVNGIMFIVLAAYIISFTVEMFAGCLTKAEIEIIDSLPEDEDTYENSYISSGGYDELVVSDKKEDDVPASDDSYEAAAQGLSDFVMGYDDDNYDESTIKDANMNDGLVLGYGEETQTQFAEEIAAEPEKEETAEPVEEIPTEPEISEELKNAKRLNVSEEKPEPVKTETPVEEPEVSNDRMSEIDRLLRELEDKK